MLCLDKFFGKSQIVFGNLKLDFKPVGLNILILDIISNLRILKV